MVFEKLEAPSLKNMFVKQMEELILSRQLPIGSKLPPERELSRQMKVSRAVVNGGMAELARKGFVQIIPRRGIFVADYQSCGSIDTLVSILEFGGNRFDPEMLDSILDARLTIETRIVELVSDNATSENFKKLYERIERISGESEPSLLGNETFEFYHELSLSTGNSIYPLLIHMFKHIYTHTFEAYYRVGLKDLRIKQLITLLDLMRECQKALAVEKVKEIIEQGRAVLGQHYTPGQKYDKDNIEANVKLNLSDE